MPNLSSRHVSKDESLRLGVASGWYGHKVSGTFVAGPFATEAECTKRVAELDPPAAPKKKN